MTLRRLGVTDFRANIAGSELVIVEWFDPRADPGELRRVFERIAPTHPRVIFGRVDVQAEAELAAEFGVDSVPRWMIFREGVLLIQDEEVLLPITFDKAIPELQALDMDELRREIAALWRE